MVVKNPKISNQLSLRPRLQYFLQLNNAFIRPMLLGRMKGNNKNRTLLIKVDDMNGPLATVHFRRL